jgi:hypothetical protein
LPWPIFSCRITHILDIAGLLASDERWCRATESPNRRQHTISKLIQQISGSGYNRFLSEKPFLQNIPSVSTRWFFIFEPLLLSDYVVGIKQA